MSLSVRASVPARDLSVAFDVAPGETLALLGPNGAGKSTALGVVAGTVTPYDGLVSLADRTLTSVVAGAVDAWVAPHERGTALLAQDPLLFPHLTCLENVAFGPRSAGVSRPEARERALQLLASMGLASLAGARPRELSGGQAQRVAIARAVAADPGVLLLDEPLAAIDVDAAPALRQTLRSALQGRTTLLVTHDVLDALLLADRVAVLEGGRIVETGATKDVLSQPRSDFAARIAGLNLVSGVWRDGAVVTSEGARVTGQLSEPLTEGQRALAVFRPNAVSVHLVEPGGSPRNRFHLPLRDLQPHAGYLRLVAGDLSADLTAASVAELAPSPGDLLWLVVKATEVSIYPA